MAQESAIGRKEPLNSKPRCPLEFKGIKLIVRFYCGIDKRLLGCFGFWGNAICFLPPPCSSADIQLDDHRLRGQWIRNI